MLTLSMYCQLGSPPPLLHRRQLNIYCQKWKSANSSGGDDKDNDDDEDEVDCNDNRHDDDDDDDDDDDVDDDDDDDDDDVDVRMIHSIGCTQTYVHSFIHFIIHSFHSVVMEMR